MESRGGARNPMWLVYHPEAGNGEGEWLRGRIDSGNLEESRRIWRMVDAGYHATGM